MAQNITGTQNDESNCQEFSVIRLPAILIVAYKLSNCRIVG
jgi:hypothetical protein